MWEGEWEAILTMSVSDEASEIYILQAESDNDKNTKMIRSCLC